MNLQFSMETPCMLTVVIYLLSLPQAESIDRFHIEICTAFLSDIYFKTRKTKNPGKINRKLNSKNLKGKTNLPFPVVCLSEIKTLIESKTLQLHINLTISHGINMRTNWTNNNQSHAKAPEQVDTNLLIHRFRGLTNSIYNTLSTLWVKEQNTKHTKKS